MKNILIKNATFENNSKKDILVKNNKIVNISENIQSDFEKFDANNLYAIPAFCDLHVHLRDPGFTYKEDIETGTRAAKNGGISELVCMPNTNPPIDNIETLQYVINQSQKFGFAKVYPCACITRGQKSEELSDFCALKEAGAIAFSDDGRPVLYASLMKKALIEAKKLNMTIISHAEELTLAKGGVINDGEISKKLGVQGIPNSAEDICTARDIILAGETDAKIHIAHVSSKNSVEIIRKAKSLGINVTAETCAHYLYFTENEVLRKATNAKMNPPLRTEIDRLSLIEAVSDGTIDCISTDHAPHSKEEKERPLKDAPMGIIGLETSFSACFTVLCKSKIIVLSKLIELMSYNPRKIICKKANKIEIGSEANFILSDLENSFKVYENQFASKSKNSPFIGENLFGRIVNIE